MKHKIVVEVPNADNIILELDDSHCPQTVCAFLKHLPFKLKANIWGQEIYTDPAPFSVSEENAKSVVELFDVAFWPPGKAICLFYGPTPISEHPITPYSPVNVIGKILAPDKSVLAKIDGVTLSFRV